MSLYNSSYSDLGSDIIESDSFRHAVQQICNELNESSGDSDENGIAGEKVTKGISELGSKIEVGCQCRALYKDGFWYVIKKKMR